MVIIVNVVFFPLSFVMFGWVNGQLIHFDWHNMIFIYNHVTRETLFFKEGDCKFHVKCSTIKAPFLIKVKRIYTSNTSSTMTLGIYTFYSCLNYTFHLLGTKLMHFPDSWVLCFFCLFVLFVCLIRLFSLHLCFCCEIIWIF